MRISSHLGRSLECTEVLRGAAGGSAERSPAPARRGVRAFTLLEVIIACAIFFMAAFAVLEMVTNGLAAAKVLQQREPDAGMLAGIYSQTNILVEESSSGDFEELYPELFPGYSWVRQTTEVASNGLFQVEYAVVHDARKKGVSETTMSVLLFRPASPPGSASKSMGGLGGR